MQWNRLILLLLLSAACFSGTFTCSGHSGDNPPQRPSNNRTVP